MRSRFAFASSPSQADLDRAYRSVPAAHAGHGCPLPNPRRYREERWGCPYCGNVFELRQDTPRWNSPFNQPPGPLSVGHWDRDVFWRWYAPDGVGDPRRPAQRPAAWNMPALGAAVPWRRTDAPGLCPACGHQELPGLACPRCRQVFGLPDGVRVSSRRRRLAATVLDRLLQLATLFVGWFCWSLVVAGRGQTPAMKLLRMRVLRVTTGTAADRSTVVQREYAAKAVAQFFTLGLAGLGAARGVHRRAVWDRVAGTLVVDDPHHALAPRPGR